MTQKKLRTKTNDWLRAYAEASMRVYVQNYTIWAPRHGSVMLDDLQGASKGQILTTKMISGGCFSQQGLLKENE